MKLVSRRREAVGLLLLTAFLWSLGGVVVKVVKWNPIAIAALRSVIAAAVLLVYVRRPRMSYSSAEIGAAVAYSATVILFVVATKWTTAANAIFLQYTSPVWAAVLGFWLLGERVRWRDWLSIGAVLTGLALFFLDGLATGTLLGNGCALLTGFTNASMIVLLRHEKNDSPFETLLLGNIVAALVGVPFMLASPPGLKTLLGIGFLGIFQLGIPYVLFATAIKHVTALEAAIIPSIEAVLNPLWVSLAIAETPRPLAIAGGVIVVGTSIIRSITAQTASTIPAE